ncbi:MAG: hypothetical protein Q8P64_12665, partial [Deltaproteobacteria bacterium]|nr:hypothetical protein [Deltaproteobacteria bacterium]
QIGIDQGLAFLCTENDVDIEADVRISHFQTPFSFVPMGLLFSFLSPAINRRSIIEYPYWDFLLNLPSS